MFMVKICKDWWSWFKHVNVTWVSTQHDVFICPGRSCSAPWSSSWVFIWHVPRDSLGCGAASRTIWSAVVTRWCRSRWQELIVEDVEVDVNAPCMSRAIVVVNIQIHPVWPCMACSVPEEKGCNSWIEKHSRGISAEVWLREERGRERERDRQIWRKKTGWSWYDWKLEIYSNGFKIQNVTVPTFFLSDRCFMAWVAVCFNVWRCQKITPIKEDQQDWGIDPLSLGR